MGFDTEREGKQQITFDARQGRTKLLLYWLGELTLAQAQNNYVGWVNSLKSLYYMCFSFVEKKDAISVKLAINKAEVVVNLHNSKRKISDSIIRKELDLATELALTKFKDQFMQTSDGDEDFNLEDFDD